MAVLRSPLAASRLTSTRRLLAIGLGCLLAGVLPSPAAAQAGAADARQFPTHWLQGYARTISGDWLVYPWSYPGQTRTLLSRATDGRMVVEWEADPPPASGEDLVTYLWHAGTASGSGAHQFTFGIDGRPVATFRSGRTTDDKTWVVPVAGGGTLSFTATRVGRFDELFGFMWLTVPRRALGDGAPRFSVTGEAAGSQDYYLGPEQRVVAWTRVQPEDAVFSNGQRVLRVSISRIGSAVPVIVRSNDRVLWSGEARTGHTTALVGAGPNVAGRVPVAVTVGADEAYVGDVECGAVLPRSLHLLPHSHVDIGYSDPQPVVERKQWQNLRDAVMLAAETAAYPDGARFRWNVEGLWSVESYLAQAPPRERDAFIAAVRAGSIGLQANYTNILTGLATPEELRRWTAAARRLSEQYGIGPGTTAMHSDIPGLNWTVVDALAAAGVRYFSSGPNYMPGLPDGGDRIGGTLRALGDRPFWWTSPSGEQRLLFWMAGHGYSWFHGLNTGDASQGGREPILDYVRGLSSAGYPYDMIQVRYTVGGDNGPVDRKLPDFVRRWNDEFATPRLVIDTADAMFAEFERRHGGTLPVRSGDMTPYWEDGAISSAAEESLARAAARRLQQAETLAALRGVRLPALQLADGWRNVILWHEHTWGAADSISHPDRADVVAQWEYKRRFAVEAERLSHDVMRAAAEAAGEGRRLVRVVNTSSWVRRGLVMVPADLSRDGDRALAGGVPRPSQRLRDGRLAVWLDEVPAFGSVDVLVVPGAAALPRAPVRVSGHAMDNGRVRVAIDPATGAIGSLTWRGAPGHEFVGRGPGLGRYLYVDGRDPAAASAAPAGEIEVDEPGPLVATLHVRGPAGGTNGATRRVTVVAGSDHVLLDVRLDKVAVRTKESGHLAWPLDIRGGTVRVDQGEALVEIERDQLPGSCRDFVGVQSAVDVSGPGLGVSIASLDAPLVEIGAITDEVQHDGRTRAWRERTAPGTTLYAYLFNNYWHTNYKADQSGPLRFRFALAPHGAFDPVALRRFSDEQDQPLLAIAAADGDSAVRAPVRLDSASVVVSALRAAADGGGDEVRLFNPSRDPVEVTLRATRPGAVVTVTGDSRGAHAAGVTLTVPARGSRSVRVAPSPGPPAPVPPR